MSRSTKGLAPTDGALIVFGTPKAAEAPQAAWFRAAYAKRIREAAQRQELTVIPVESSETRVAAADLDEGHLKPGGQLMMPSVSPDVIGRLRELVPVLAVARVSATLWDTLKVSDVVLAADLDDGEPNGWYEAAIVSIEDGVYTLRWFYTPEEGLVRLRRQHIALMFSG